MLRHADITMGPFRSQRGSILLLSIVILTVLLLLGSSLLERTQDSVARTTVESRAAKSFHLAEAGIHQALYSLDEGTGWVTYAGGSDISLPGGGAHVTVSPTPAARASTQLATVVATGWITGPNGSQRYPKTIRVITYWDPNYFDFAVFGDTKVDVQNGRVNVSPNGHVSELGTNNKHAGAVTVSPQGVVVGNVVVGYGATSAPSCVDNKGTVTGTVDSLDMPKFLPSIKNVPAGAVAMGNVDVATTVTLNAGVYWMTNLRIHGNGKIVCNGEVEIYTGTPGSTTPASIDIGGNGVLNISGVAHNLKIFGFDNLTQVTIGGNGDLRAGVYAPKAVVTLNSGDIHGSLVARTVTINGSTSTVYYDDTLDDVSKPCATIASWEVL